MFELLKTTGKARRGKIKLAHGEIETPFFMPIATKGAVKTMSSKDMEDLGAQILLSNTYHLLLRPGMDAMKKYGGLHKFMNWNKPILTDSGGYQVFSLSKLNKITEEGVLFQSHVDGSRIELTPEKSMEMQAAIGADMIMQFDDVAAGTSSYDRFEDAMERSLRWAKRCKENLPPFQGGIKGGYDQKLFGIVQGGIHEDLRKRSAEGLTEIGFDGYAIGGLSVGEPREDCYKFTKFTCDNLPEDKPRYFMGGGMPEEIVQYVSFGVDMFDCVIPTRNARHGTLFTWKQDPSKVFSPLFKGGLRGVSTEEGLRGVSLDFYNQTRITNERFAFDDSAIDPHCSCVTCATTSKAYLRHLFQVNEILALRLATIHNLAFYLDLMHSLRNALS